MGSFPEAEVGPMRRNPSEIMLAQHRKESPITFRVIQKCAEVYPKLVLPHH